jgi:hypothetical protein
MSAAISAYFYLVKNESNALAVSLFVELQNHRAQVSKDFYEFAPETGERSIEVNNACSMRKDLGMKDDDVLMVEKDTIVVPKSEDSGIEILITPTKMKGIAQYQSNIEDYFKRKRAEKDNAGNDLKRRKI